MVSHFVRGYRDDYGVRAEWQNEVNRKYRGTCIQGIKYYGILSVLLVIRI